MSQINFLPEMFHRSRRRQQRRPAEFLVIGMTMIALAGLYISTSGPDSALAVQSDQLDQSLEEVAQLRAEQDRLVIERSALERKLMTARETYQPITATQVLSRISALAPESIRLVNAELSTERPTPEIKPDPNAKTKTVGKDDQPLDPNLMRITITGHAPTDEQLVTLIRRLDSDPVFTSVALRGSRLDKTETHFVRVFHLDVVIDLDRRFMGVEGGESDAD
ncbi:MAG: hypothetical protein AAGB26_18610 [Planctomycetota bacterium]